MAMMKVVNIDIKMALSAMPFLLFEIQSMSAKILRTSSFESASIKRFFKLGGMKRFGRMDEATMIATSRAR